MKKLSLALFLFFASCQCIVAEPCRKVPPPECKAEDIVEYHPHQDCSLFYRCEGGTLNIYSCPLEERFSPELHICVPAQHVECCDVEVNLIKRVVRKFNKLIGNKENVQSYEVNIPIISDTDAAECEDIPTCGIFDWGVTKPYPPDCTLYISCDSAGNMEVLQCPEGEEYSPTEFKCMDPALANCPQCEVASTTAQP